MYDQIPYSKGFNNMGEFLTLVSVPHALLPVLGLCM
jgi:hypothetical protein